ncbi:ANTAR domain-containing protein [Devosia sp. A369]
MNDYVENLPFVALVDDDQHSAQLLTRMLLGQGSPAIAWYGDGHDGATMLRTVLGNPAANWPSLLIVDLKAHSSATLEFIAAIQPLARQKGVPVVVMAPPLGPRARDALHDSGAAAVFCRHADLDAYRREAAGIVSFWAQSQRLDAVGM